MKKLLLLPILVLVFPTTLPGRVLKSADGSKALDAQFVRYIANRDTVTLRQGDGRNIVVPAARFSEEDRSFFIEAQMEIDKKEAIKVKIEPNNDYSKEARGQLVFSSRTVQYAFEVSNSSESYFNGLELRYWIVLQQADRTTGDNKINIISDRKQLMPLAGGSSETVESPSIKLTLGAKSASTSTCRKSRANAASAAGAVGRERVIGTKVEVVDAKGEVIYSDVSSNRVASLLADKKGN